AVILSGLAFVLPVRRAFARMMRTRLAIFLPIVWFVAVCAIYWNGSNAINTPRSWSAIQTWQATIFVWLCAYWLIGYAPRPFHFDQGGRRALISLSSFNLVVWLLIFFMPFLIVPPIPFPDFVQHFSKSPAGQDGLVVYMSLMNSDALEHYVPY